MSGHSRDPSGRFLGQDLTGKVYQWIKVDEFLFNSPTRGNTWACHCINCGKKHEWTTSQITRTKTSTCTCVSNPCTYTRDFAGMTIGGWDVLVYVRSGVRGRMWKCECIHCGKFKEFNSHDLKISRTTVCPCQKGKK